MEDHHEVSLKIERSCGKKPRCEEALGLVRALRRVSRMKMN
jgi:hypothetical protein